MYIDTLFSDQVYDPNSAAVDEVNSASCSVTWNWDGITTEKGPNNDFSDAFSVCLKEPNRLFQTYMEDFQSPQSFRVMFSHKFKDEVYESPRLVALDAVASQTNKKGKKKKEKN
jgi:hypothetical protein